MGPLLRSCTSHAQAMVRHTGTHHTYRHAQLLMEFDDLVLYGNRTTLQLAVEQEWGGPRSNEKYDDLVDTLLDKCVKRWDRKQPYNEDEVWELLDAALTEQFNVVADDGSVDEVPQHTHATRPVSMQ